MIAGLTGPRFLLVVSKIGLNFLLQSNQILSKLIGQPQNLEFSSKADYAIISFLSSESI